MFILLPPDCVKVPQLEDFRREFIEDGSDMNGGSGLKKAESAYMWLFQRPWLTYPGNYQFFSYDTRVNEIVGAIRISTQLNAGLVLTHGLNIGYSIRPALRGQGFGTLQLALGLNYAKSFGLREVLISAEVSNVASQKIILANKGEMDHQEEDFYIFKIDLGKELL